MSRPQFPDMPDLSRQDAINQVIASIASEELALSHILNAEGEKIQYAVGTLPGLVGGSTIEDVTDINESASDMLG
ncbi:MAG TPA: collagen-like protein, partial [Oscillospiraceae bacterium]|nr:collagen-like protein [Oscillospiraceae bacterium]